MKITIECCESKERKTLTVERVKWPNDIIQLLVIECVDGNGKKEAYRIARDYAQAAKAAKYYWEYLAYNDMEFSIDQVSLDAIVRWAVGRYGGPPDYEKARSFSEWLDDVVGRDPGKTLACDGMEWNIEYISRDLVENLGFEPTLAYRVWPVEI